MKYGWHSRLMLYCVINRARLSASSSITYRVRVRVRLRVRVWVRVRVRGRVKAEGLLDALGGEALDLRVVLRREERLIRGRVRVRVRGRVGSGLGRGSAGEERACAPCLRSSSISAALSLVLCSGLASAAAPPPVWS